MEVALGRAVVGPGVGVAAVGDGLGEEPVQRLGVAQLVLGERADRDVLLEDRADPGPLGIGEPDDELVVGHREQEQRERPLAAVAGAPETSIASGSKRGADPSSTARVRLRLGLARLLAGRRELVAHDVAAGLLERAVERRLEQVEVVEDVDVGAPDDPQVDALLAPAEHLAGVVQGELASGAMTEPPWRIGSPSFSRRNTSHASSTPDAPGPLSAWSAGIESVMRPPPEDRRGSRRGPSGSTSRLARRNSSRSCDLGRGS